MENNFEGVHMLAMSISDRRKVLEQRIGNALQEANKYQKELEDLRKECIHPGVKREEPVTIHFADCDECGSRIPV